MSLSSLFFPFAAQFLMSAHSGRRMTTPGTLYRLASGSAATPATPTNSPYGQPAKPYAVGSIQNGSERNRILELLRAPNSLTSPTLEPSSKGLLNGPGQNNCFLNCAVQVSILQLIYDIHMYKFMYIIRKLLLKFGLQLRDATNSSMASSQYVTTFNIITEIVLIGRKVWLKSVLWVRSTMWAPPVHPLYGLQSSTVCGFTVSVSFLSQGKLFTWPIVGLVGQK